MGISEECGGERTGGEITAVVVKVRAARVSVRATVKLCLFVFSSPGEFTWIYEGKKTERLDICTAFGSITRTWNFIIM